MKIIAEKLEASPEELAQAFCDLGSDEIAVFFAECERISLEWRKAHNTKPVHQRGLFFGAGWFWHDVGEQCLQRGGMDGPAARVLATMAAPLYAHSMRYIENYGQRIQQVND